MWQIKEMNALTGLEFFKIAQLRQAVFVVEQKRLYQEFDEIDLRCEHCFYIDPATHELLAYARLFLEEDKVTFGRVTTSASIRGTGFGDTLLTTILAFIEKKWPRKEVFIEAQEQAIGFYRKHDFVIVGPPFTFNLTPHVRMELKKVDPKIIN